MGCTAGSRGQALPLVVVILGTGAAMLWLVATVGSAVLDREQARHAADAAALAAAASGPEVAAEVARRNGAVLEMVAWEGDQVRVRVRRGWFRATARAERQAAVVVDAPP